MSHLINRRVLVISDVDGSLLRSDKTLSERNLQAVRQLTAHGIDFTLSSSRPPFGLRVLSEQLGLQLPIGAYNGGTLVAPDLAVLEQKLIAPETVLKILAVLRSFAVDAWLFTAGEWMTPNPDGIHVALETRTVAQPPKIVPRLEDCVEGIAKMVGVSDDPQRLASCETALRAAIGDGAAIARSQVYYLDVTPAGTNKGTTVTSLMQRLGLAADDIVSLGDMENDVSMFQESGFSIAMGNATPDVQRHASAVAPTNDADGFADAVESLILPWAARAMGER